MPAATDMPQPGSAGSFACSYLTWECGRGSVARSIWRARALGRVASWSACSDGSSSNVMSSFFPYRCQHFQHLGVLLFAQQVHLEIECVTTNLPPAFPRSG